jgi:hypothetical protein
MSSAVVECYSGQSYPERPRALLWEGERFEVIEILSRWRSPKDIHFLVRIKDGRMFELIYTEIEDSWDIDLR